MFEKFANSWALAKSSWTVLRTDKQLVVFPIVSGIACLLVMVSFAVPFALIPGLRDQFQDAQGNVQSPPWMWAVLFAYYFCSYFVVVFCQSALMSCALIRFNGGEPTLGDGFRVAFSRLPQIFAWALVSATVGVALKAIEQGGEKVGQIISAILGTAWSVITYFVVPVLVVEKVGPIQAISRSLSILRKTWGEALIGNLGLGLFTFLLLIPVVLLFVVGVMLCMVLLPLGIAVLVVAVIALLLWMAVSSALNGIYLGALYQFAANDQVPDGFDRYTFQRAFKPKAA